MVDAVTRHDAVRHSTGVAEVRVRGVNGDDLRSDCHVLSQRHVVTGGIENRSDVVDVGDADVDLMTNVHTYECFQHRRASSRYNCRIDRREMIEPRSNVMPMATSRRRFDVQRQAAKCYVVTYFI
jgi:hypothetical protein